GYVVLDRTRASRRFRADTPDYFVSPEAVWATVFRSSKGNILVLDPTSPPRSGRAGVIVPPHTIQARAAGKRRGAHSTRRGTANSLHVEVEQGARVVLIDGVSPGLSPPPPGVN